MRLSAPQSCLHPTPAAWFNPPLRAARPAPPAMIQPLCRAACGARPSARCAWSTVPISPRTERPCARPAASSSRSARLCPTQLRTARKANATCLSPLSQTDAESWTQSARSVAPSARGFLRYACASPRVIFRCSCAARLRMAIRAQD